MKSFFRSCLYYGIFFGLSAVVHYLLCFYQPKSPKPAASKTIAIPLPALVAAADEKIEKPPAPQPPVPVEPDKPPKPIRYQENLEKELEARFQEKMAQWEAKKAQEMAQREQQLQQQHEQKQNELAQKMQEVEKKISALEERKQELEAQQATALRQQQERSENAKVLQQTLVEKLAALQKENEAEVQRALAKMEQEQRAQLEKEKQKQAQLARQAEQERQEEWQRKNQEFEVLRQQVERVAVAQQEEQKKIQLENKQLLARQQAMENQLQEQRSNLQISEEQLRARQEKLEEEILRQKLLLEAESRSLTQPATSSTGVPKRERELIVQQWQSLEQLHASSLEQHREYIRKFSTLPDDGVVVPLLDFFDEDFKRNCREIMQFHRMELIAYSPPKPSYFISIDLDRSLGDGRYRSRTDFAYLQNFSNRNMVCNIFPHLVQEIRRSSFYHPGDGEILVALVFPHQTANYLAWKSTTVCKKFGYDPKEVTSCQCVFRKTRTGFWSLIVRSLVLKKTDETIPVNDFEENW